MSMEPGDPCVVTNVDGEQTDGVVHAIRDTDVDIYEFDGEPLYEYWSETTVEHGEDVVAVNLGGAVYDYPESRVNVP